MEEGRKKNGGNSGGGADTESPRHGQMVIDFLERTAGYRRFICHCITPLCNEAEPRTAS